MQAQIAQRAMQIELNLNSKLLVLVEPKRSTEVHLKLELMKEVTIAKEPVELCKILKFENLVESGGAAKFVINEGKVKVNGAVETRKRKKINAGDTIEFQNETFIIKLTEAPTELS